MADSTHAARGRRSGEAATSKTGEKRGGNGLRSADLAAVRSPASSELRLGSPRLERNKLQFPGRGKKIIQTWEKKEEWGERKKNPVVSCAPRLGEPERRMNTSSRKMSKEERNEREAAARCSPDLRASLPSAPAASG